MVFINHHHGLVREDLLNRLWPPERYGNAVLRKAFPTKALGNVYVLVQNLQLVILGAVQGSKIMINNR